MAAPGIQNKAVTGGSTMDGNAVKIKYIGHKAEVYCTWNDRPFYFKRDEAMEIPSPLAALLLKQADKFEAVN